MNKKIGIDDIAFQAPKLYLPIAELAEARGIENSKLKFGLGLEQMSVCDADEDIVTLSAAAALKLIKQQSLNPKDIGRIYMGTESTVDGSKPISSYVHGLLNKEFENKGYGPNALLHADVVDMTFACIGAVDAMQNSLYYVAANPGKVAIVIAGDIANYDLGSSGEYTQGAGAIALLIKEDPQLMEIDPQWGVATQNEHDFFKPIRLEMRDGELQELHDEKPIFDGQFSNQTYQDRITEAWAHYDGESAITSFGTLVFHLPYAFHGRRIIAPLYLNELRQQGKLNALAAENGLDPDSPDFTKLFTKTDHYKNWVGKTIAKGEQFSSAMGNLYTASIFLSLMSSLENGDHQPGESILFFAYGSGSKSKVFSAKLGDQFNERVMKWKTAEQLEQRKAISFDDYIALRTTLMNKAIEQRSGFMQISSGSGELNRFSREYAYREVVLEASGELSKY